MEEGRRFNGSNCRKAAEPEASDSYALWRSRPSAPGTAIASSPTTTTANIVEGRSCIMFERSIEQQFAVQYWGDEEEIAGMEVMCGCVVYKGGVLLCRYA